MNASLFGNFEKQAQGGQARFLLVFLAPSSFENTSTAFAGTMPKNCELANYMLAVARPVESAVYNQSSHLHRVCARRFSIKRDLASKLEPKMSVLAPKSGLPDDDNLCRWTVWRDDAQKLPQAESSVCNVMCGAQRP